VIRSILARLPPHLGDDKRAEVEAELAHHARTLDAGQLTVLGKRILAYLDQDGPRPHDTPEPGATLASGTATMGVNWPDGSTAKPSRSSAQH
jgi:hypothetical protein